MGFDPTIWSVWKVPLEMTSVPTNYGIVGSFYSIFFKSKNKCFLEILKINTSGKRRNLQLWLLSRLSYSIWYPNTKTSFQYSTGKHSTGTYIRAALSSQNNFQTNHHLLIHYSLTFCPKIYNMSHCDQGISQHHAYLSERSAFPWLFHLKIQVYF